MRSHIRPRVSVFFDNPSGGEKFTLEIGTGGPTITYELTLPFPLRTTIAKAVTGLVDRVNDNQHNGLSNIRAAAERDYILFWSTDPSERVQVSASSPILQFSIVDDQEDPDDDQIDASLLAAPSHRPLVTAF